MTGKILIRLVGVFTCVAMVVSGWDAEAGWRHHRRTSCCCAPVYEPVCAPVCEPVCAPACEPVCAPCCETVATCCPRPAYSYVVVEREIVVPTTGCCNGRIAAAKDAVPEQAPTVVKASPQPVPAVAVSTSGSATAR
jgi:hypothetical protein